MVTKSSVSPHAMPAAGDQPEPLDSCWGFFGLDACLAEAEARLICGDCGEEPEPEDRGDAGD